MTKIQMIEEFICSGCVAGSDTLCGKYKPFPNEDKAGMCQSHVCGTHVFSPGVGGFTIALGMPKGFNRPSWCHDHHEQHAKMMIRVWPKGTQPEWDFLNVPVWALEHEG